jgi:hypothetical protein
MFQSTCGLTFFQVVKKYRGPSDKADPETCLLYNNTLRRKWLKGISTCFQGKISFSVRVITDH